MHSFLLNDDLSLNVPCQDDHNHTISDEFSKFENIVRTNSTHESIAAQLREEPSALQVEP